jgi:hypothetical protein
MTYYIFLKSLRILEEFRTIPHIKIPLKSPCTKFQSSCKFKNPNFNSKRISLLVFGPAGPLGDFGPPGLFLPPPASNGAGAATTTTGLTLPPWPPLTLFVARGKTSHYILFISPIKRCPPSSLPSQ